MERSLYNDDDHDALDDGDDDDDDDDWNTTAHSPYNAIMMMMKHLMQCQQS